MRATSGKSVKLRAYRVLADAIMKQILDGRLREGDPLPTEARLCEEFGVNRSTVREGIRVLEEACMVRRAGNAKTMFVSRPSSDETGAYLERTLVLNEITFGELWEAMLTIEPTTARLAAEKRDASILAQLDANLEITEVVAKKGGSLIALDIEFHNLVATMSANRALNFTREPIGRLFYLSFQRVMSRTLISGKRMLKAHQAIADAIRSGNAVDAENWMAKHILDFRRGMDLVGVNPEMPVAGGPQYDH